MQPTSDIEIGDWLGAQEALGHFLLSRFGPSQPAAAIVDDLSAYEGQYLGRRRSHTTWERFLGLLMNPPIRVSAVEDGLIIDGRGPYRPIGDHTFQRDSDATGVRRVAFSIDTNGQASRAYLFPGLDVAPRVGWGHAADLAPAFLIGLVVALTGVFTLVYPRQASPGGWSERAKYLPPIMLLTLIGGIGAIALGHAPEEDLFFAIGRSHLHPWRFATLILTLNLIALASLALLVASVQAWRVRRRGRGWVGTFARVHITLVTLGWLAMFPFLMKLNLLGWNWPG